MSNLAIFIHQDLAILVPIEVMDSHNYAKTTLLMFMQLLRKCVNCQASKGVRKGRIWVKHPP